MPNVVPTGAVVTTRIPYNPMGPWMDGCVPDSIRYVPGLRAGVGVAQVVPQHSVAVVPAVTSVANDCTRTACAGGAFVVVGSAMGHVIYWELEWSGGVVQVTPWTPMVSVHVGPVVPRPPPNWPTITSE